MTTNIDHRLEWLDSLRGIAALTVVVAHLLAYYRDRLGIMSDAGGEFAAALTLDYLDFGKFGVVLFFCISGFLIPSSLKSGGWPDIREFWIGRFFRLYPLYWLSIPFGLVLTWPGTYGFSPTATLANLTMVQNLLGQPNVIGVYWTLQIEILFYMGCTGLALFGLNAAPRAFLLSSVGMTVTAVGMSAARGYLGVRLPVAVPLGLALMFWATLQKMWLLDRDLVARRCGLWAIGLLVAVFPLIANLGYGQDLGFRETWYRYTISYYAGIAVFTFVVQISVRPLVYLGQISYSTYLVHPLVFSVVVSTGLEAWLLAFAGRTVAAIVTIACVVAVASVTYRTVELPMLKLGRTVRRQLRPQSRASETPAAASVLR